MSVYPDGAEVTRGALIDGAYRYVLGRRWAPGPVATFVMLNPSTADGETDDPTIRRVIGFARALGCGNVHVLNLYAYRATKPANLWRAEADGADVIGPRNDEILERHALSALERRDPFIAAWGAEAKPARVARLLAIPGVAVNLTALGTTAAGAPRHPLYLAAAARPTRWTPPGSP